jgi:hypothetical protein
MIALFALLAFGGTIREEVYLGGSLELRLSDTMLTRTFLVPGAPTLEAISPEMSEIGTWCPAFPEVAEARAWGVQRLRRDYRDLGVTQLEETGVAACGRATVEGEDEPAWLEFSFGAEGSGPRGYAPVYLRWGDLGWYSEGVSGEAASLPEGELQATMCDERTGSCGETLEASWAFASTP